MRYVEVGGLRLSAIGLGTWQFGSREWGYGAGYASDTAPAIVRRAIELGVTLIDTAEIYGFGRSERIVGEAIRGQREGLVIATKLVPVLPLPSVVGWQVRGSLRRLEVEALRSGLAMRNQSKVPSTETEGPSGCPSGPRCQDRSEAERDRGCRDRLDSGPS
jgi:aryl-alcohol dehydrogenase-like predicted oxidoreductase